MNTGRRRAPPRPAAASSPPPRNQPPRRRGPTVVGAGGSQQREAFLVAWDPVAQEERWRIRFERPGVTSGTLATAGNLLFHGSNDGSFSAYRADKGEKLWSIQLAPGFANPMTYMLDGRQYVAVATGRSGYQAPGRVYAFALDANTPVPSMDPVPEPPAPLGLTRDALGTVLAEFEQAGLRAGPGRDLIQQLCAGCHSPTIITRYRQSEEAWRLTVQDMLSRGMAGTPEQHEQVIRYLTTHLGPEN
ncbi:MAG: PQQ-binding-like beta-propeller repeat protein, partial [Acidobacteriota bacterium]